MCRMDRLCGAMKVGWFRQNNHDFERAKICGKDILQRVAKSLLSIQRYFQETMTKGVNDNGSAFRKN